MKIPYLTLLCFLAGASSSFAVEGALPRTVSGASVMPYQGLIPPDPGWLVGVGETFYNGDIGAARPIPIHGNLALDVEGTLSFTPLTLMYIWDTHSECWNFASGVTLPLAYVDIEASVTAGPFLGQRSDDKFGLFDIAVTPLIASYHFSKTDHMSLGLTVWAPTGEYEEGALANLSTNTWTFIPTVAYTKILPGPNIELTAQWSLQFYTENPATDYQDGVVSDLEFTAIKRFQNGFGIGLVGSWMDQLNDDSGPTADRLNGFSGRAFGVGPIIAYSTKLGESDFSVNARWVHEFDNENLLEGDVGMLNLSLKF
ncbi:transporter [Haloferula sp. BvORR071]|uniref:SphA family protein n=1 Tax=Haloferula sp. BvORR071 TaxID=1396141 RepID=UPI000698BC92|nr:transporter [Haloferula sp. BvORR071]